MIDTHAHLDDEAFDSDREACLQRAREAGVSAMVVPAVSPERWERTLSVARLPGVYAALGVHPHALARVTDDEIRRALDRVSALAKASEGRVVAIGEVGFDRTIDSARASDARQAEVFAWHAEVAVALGLPLIVHVLRAHDCALATLSRVRLPSPAGVIHSYSGSAELVRAYERLGFYVSFAGGVTRPNARRVAEAARAVSSERLLIETDAPDQCPTGAGEGVVRSEPAMIGLIASAVARARAESDEWVREVSESNARRVFGLG
ncbi:MAG: TatD family hydrolase [Polyangiales bacterium]